MNNFKAQDKALKQARAVVNTLKFGTQEWEEAMQVVRNLVEKQNAADQAIINHKCDFSR